nr:calcium/sodium antiporter [Lysobacter sp. CAU 1642]
MIFIAGLAALVAGAELLVRGASRMALSLGISPLVVGLTIVAMGTSAPEVAVSVGAAMGGQVDIAVGNVVGSNIFNVLFILGVSALIVPLVVDTQIIRQEVPIMIGASILLLSFGIDGTISNLDAGLLLLLLIVYTSYVVIQSRREGKAQRAKAESSAEPPPGRLWLQLLLIAAGLGLLVVGSGWLVDASTQFARALGVSDVIIGLTIVAAGTSMPEVATSITAAIRGERDIAIGNVVGSNIFNILGCLGLAGLVSGDGLPMAPSVLNFDLWVMIAVAFACLPVFIVGRTIARWEGALFLFYFVAYTAYLILAARDHDALDEYSGVMLGFVVPLTVVTLVVSLTRNARRHPAA